MKKEDLICKNCIYCFENKANFFCRRYAPTRPEEYFGSKVPKDYWCGEGKWREYFESNRNSTYYKEYCWGHLDILRTP